MYNFDVQLSAEDVSHVWFTSIINLCLFGLLGF